MIGSVSGVNGNPPATTFTDVNPPAGTLIYTIATTLLPVPIDPTTRSSAPSQPAVLAVGQSIVLGPLPSSVPLSSSTPSTLTVTATAESNNTGSGLSANGQQVSFTASGQCSAGNSSINGQGVSSATVTLNSIGSCTITASQGGDTTAVPLPTTAYSAATPVSGTFTILPQGSTTQSQMITFGTLPSAQYGGSPFAVSATSNSGLPVSFSGPASGQPCSVSGTTVTIAGAGLCRITASQSGGQANNITYSAASVTQSFNISTAPLTVTANPVTIAYGQPIPTTFNYTFGTFVGTDTASVVSGTPVLSTTATSSSPIGTYPITVSTGSLAATNYSFLYVPGTLTIGSTAPMVSWSIPPPLSAVYGSQFTVVATSNSSGTITYSTSGGCTNVAGLVTMNSGTTACLVSASVAAAGNYGIGSVGPTSVSATLAAPTVSWSTPPPTSAGYGSQFTVVAASNSGGTITYSTSGGCTNVAGLVTMNSSTTACLVSASVAAAGNYGAGSVGPTSVSASGPVITVSPSSINFGAVALDSITIKTVTLSNTGSATATISSPRISLLKAGNADEFVMISLCPTSLPAGKSCTLTVTFVAGAYYNTPQTATLEVMDNAPGSPQPVALSATVLQPQTITFTSVPSSSVYNSSFPVAATGGGSGNPVTFTASGACSVPPGSATYTMTSGSGTCLVIANQAGNSTYSAAAQVTKNVTATLAAQTITLTNVPSSAAYKSTFTVGATASSGLGVTFTSSGSCTNSGVTYTMTKSTGTCSVIANQPGNSNYSAASQVTKSVTVALAAQTISFTTSPPASAAYKTTFPVAATASSGLVVTFTSSGSCTNSGATYTMTKSTGTCSVIANQAGNSNYSAAPTLTQTVTATLASQTITFTTSPPATAAYKTSFSVAATGGASGNAVTFTSSGSCTNSGATFTMTSGTGTCSVIANQAANSNYLAAPTVTKTATATYSTATLAPASLNFGTVSSGHSSASQTATLKNTGTTPLIVSNIAFTGTNSSSFTQTNTCPASSSSLAAGKSCTIAVTFKSGGVPASASLTVTDNTAPPGTQTVSVSGN